MVKTTLKTKNNMNKELIKVVGIGVAINLILPMVVKPLATEDEIKPPTGNAADLPFKSQLVHMMVHHAQVPLSSSIIVGTIVGLSYFLSKKI